MAVFSKAANIALLTTAGVCFATTLALIYLLQKQSKAELYEDFAAIKSSRHTVIEVPIPTAAIGAVIGRNGCSVAKIQEATSTRINFKNEVKGSTTRIAIIRGKPNDVQAAERLIRTAVAERMTVTCEKMQIPVKACGFVIGKNGTNVRTIREASNAKLQLESLETGDFRTLTIIGTPKEIDIAKAMTEEMVAKALTPRKAANELSTANRLINYQHKHLCISLHQEHAERKPETVDLVPTGQDQFLEVFVSSAKSPDQFWVQPTGVKATELDKLVEEMTDFYTDSENINEYRPDKVELSDILAAPFTYDNCWYRVKVISIEEDEYDAENSTITVNYVDFGDEAALTKKDLYCLKDDFKTLEFQAVECKINNVQPMDSNHWSETAVKLFKDLTYCSQWKRIMLKVTNEEESTSVKCVQLIDTYGETDVNVAAALVEHGFARWTSM